MGCLCSRLHHLVRERFEFCVHRSNHLPTSAAGATFVFVVCHGTCEAGSRLARRSPPSARRRGDAGGNACYVIARSHEGRRPTGAVGHRAARRARPSIRPSGSRHDAVIRRADCGLNRRPRMIARVGGRSLYRRFAASTGKHQNGRFAAGVVVLARTGRQRSKPDPPHQDQQHDQYAAQRVHRFSD